MAASLLTKESLKFLEIYLNNASPTGYEWSGQKLWMNYALTQSCHRPRPYTQAAKM